MNVFKINTFTVENFMAYLIYQEATSLFESSVDRFSKRFRAFKCVKDKLRSVNGQFMYDDTILYNLKHAQRKRARATSARHPTP